MDCQAACIAFDGGEVKHHHDCKYYPGSISEELDNYRNNDFKVNTALIIKASNIAKQDLERYNSIHGVAESESISEINKLLRYIWIMDERKLAYDKKQKDERNAETFLIYGVTWDEMCRIVQIHENFPEDSPEWKDANAKYIEMEKRGKEYREKVK